MKANELMIDDWVRIKGEYLTTRSPYSQGPFRVHEILNVGINPFWIGAEVDDVIGFYMIEPIPLTPEILKRNGFILTEVGDNGIATPRKNINRYEKHECKTKWRDIIMWYDRITKKWCLHGINSIQLNYVHELQHALRLCRIEMEIIL